MKFFAALFALLFAVPVQAARFDLTTSVPVTDFGWEEFSGWFEGEDWDGDGFIRSDEIDSFSVSLIFVRSRLTYGVFANSRNTDSTLGIDYKLFSGSIKDLKFATIQDATCLAGAGELLIEHGGEFELLNGRIGFDTFGLSYDRDPECYATRIRSGVQFTDYHFDIIVNGNDVAAIVPLPSSAFLLLPAILLLTRRSPGASRRAAACPRGSLR